jgi:hypothetical protein
MKKIMQHIKFKNSSKILKEIKLEGSLKNAISRLKEDSMPFLIYQTGFFLKYLNFSIKRNLLLFQKFAKDLDK